MGSLSCPVFRQRQHRRLLAFVGEQRRQGADDDARGAERDDGPPLLKQDPCSAVVAFS